MKHISLFSLLFKCLCLTFLSFMYFPCCTIRPIKSLWHWNHCKNKLKACSSSSSSLHFLESLNWFLWVIGPGISFASVLLYHLCLGERHSGTGVDQCECTIFPGASADKEVLLLTSCTSDQLGCWPQWKVPIMYMTTCTVFINSTHGMIGQILCRTGQSLS